MSFFSLDTAERKAGMLLVAVMVCAMIYGFYHDERTAPQKQFVEAPAIPAIKTVPQEDIAVPKVRVYRKAEAVKKLHLPGAVAIDSAKQVTSTAEVAPSKAGSEVVSVLDTTTGVTSMLVKEKPLPFFGVENQKRIGIGYGGGTRGPEAKLFGEWTAVRVGGFYVGAQTEISAGSGQRPEAKAFAVIDYRF